MLTRTLMYLFSNPSFFQNNRLHTCIYYIDMSVFFIICLLTYFLQKIFPYIPVKFLPKHRVVHDL